MADVKKRLQEIVDSAVERDGDSDVETMIVASHLSQMRMFGIRGGVEFFAQQDNFGNQRKDFIDRVVKYNQIDSRLDSIWDYFLADGKGLFYVRPVEGTYKIFYFRKKQYRSYYGEDGELDKVVILYDYKVQRKNGLGVDELGTDIWESNPGNSIPMHGTSYGSKKYIRIEIGKNEIIETRSFAKLNFDSPSGFIGGETKELVNTLEFIPCVEVFNNPRGFSNEGDGEFNWLASHIVVHDELCKSMRNNVQFFGNPTLLSSRPKSDLIEAGDEFVQRPSVSSQSGFSGIGTRSQSTFKQNPLTRSLDGGIRVPRVIANLEPNDRVGYTAPPSITGDQGTWSRLYREEIRTALGGVDELSISAGIGATEYRSVFGRVCATAKKKARALYTYGICRCLELMVYQEERLFRETFAMAVKLEKPPELPTDATEDAKLLRDRIMRMYEKELDQRILMAIESRNLPRGVIGLIPDGNIEVNWRWTGPVYEESTQDILNNSIVVRNLQELGVDSIEALRYLFPSKTDEERAAMLSGYPFRMISELQNSFASFARTVGGLMSTPHPQAPDLPMAADPRFDMTPYLYRTLEALQKEMSYAGRYRPIDPTDEPDRSVEPVSVRTSGSGGVSNGAPELRVQQQPSFLPSSTSAKPLPDPNGVTINPVTLRPPTPDQQSLGNSVQSGSGPLERANPIPLPGATVNDGSSTTVLPVQQSSATNFTQLGSADLASKPDILAQLFPNFFGAVTQLGNQAGGGSVRTGSPRNSESVRPATRKRSR
jgi:hypothetical protein